GAVAVVDDPDRDEGTAGAVALVDTDRVLAPPAAGARDPDLGAAAADDLTEAGADREGRLDRPRVAAQRLAEAARAGRGLGAGRLGAAQLDVGAGTGSEDARLAAAGDGQDARTTAKTDGLQAPRGSAGQVAAVGRVRLEGIVGRPGQVQAGVGAGVVGLAQDQVAAVGRRRGQRGQQRSARGAGQAEARQPQQVAPRPGVAIVDRDR